MTHSLANELNKIIQTETPEAFGLLSELGREFYFPKGILTQTAEARQKAKRFNATIGIAREAGRAMHLKVVMDQLPSLTPDEALNYAPSFGNPDLRKAWRDQILAKNPSLNAGEVGLPVVTSGITHGLSLVADLFVDSGDPVFVPDQLWGNYNMIFGVRRGARMARYPLFSNEGGLNVAGLASALETVSPGGKAVLVLNFPNNPTGYTPTENEFDDLRDALLAVAKGGRRVVVVLDDAYFGLTHDATAARESLFARVAGRHPRLVAIKLDGATKEDFVWGLRVGFLTFGGLGSKAFEALEKKVAGAVRGGVSNVPQLSQSLLLKAMARPTYEEERRAKRNLLKARYEQVRTVLARPEFNEVWTPYPFNSGYFLCVKMKDLNAEVFRLHLLDEHGVGVIATAPTDIRVAYSCLETDEIEPAFDAMRRCALALRTDPEARDLSKHAEAFEE